MPKKFQVIKATTRDIPGVYVGGREKRFSKNGTFETSDPGEAAEINKVLGMKGTGEVVVTPFKEKEPGHTYTFGTSRKFANAWDEMMRRRAQKAKTKKKRTTRGRRREAHHGLQRE
jgi:hypothetical protein